MRVLVVGSGAREHALAWRLARSPSVQRVYCAPGNAGTDDVAENVPVGATDLPGLRDAARRLRVDLTLVGPEAPLAEGIVDLLEADRLVVFGPTRAAARLEWSKAWTKELLLRHHIPTGHAEIVSTESDARDAANRLGLPVVVKADGLASGKGVWVCHSAAELDAAFAALFRDRALGSAGDRVLVEECLVGPELSVLAFADGERFALMPPSRDHKRLLDADRGPNTGGMGAFAPPADTTPALLDWIARQVVQPTLAAMSAEGTPYRGVLYAGLMLTPDGPKVLEFNCRFGDPETQVILPLLESDLAETCLAVAERRLDPTAIHWGQGAVCGVVLAAEGYPERPRQGDPIRGLGNVPTDVTVFHAGTRRASDGADVLTAGGRVLTLVARGASLDEARRRVYDAVPLVHFDGMQYRADVGLGAAVPAADPQPLTPAARGGR